MAKTKQKIQNYQDLLEQAVKKYETNTAFIIKRNKKDKEISYYEFKQDVDALCQILIQKKIQNEKIAIISENRYEWCVTYLATIQTGNIIFPLDKLLKKEELVSILIQSEVKIIFYSNKQREKIKELQEKGNSKLQILINFDDRKDENGEISYEQLLNQGKYLIDHNKNENKVKKTLGELPSIIIYTSGTTEKTKAVMLSEQNICENIIGIEKILKIKQKDRLLSILPLHHTYECTLGFLLPIYRGATIVFGNGYQSFYQYIIDYHPTILMGVPLIYEKIENKIKQSLILKKRFFNFSKKKIQKFLGGRLKKCYCGAAMLDPECIEFFRKYHIKLYQAYGLTEASPVVSIEGTRKQKSGSVGKILDNIQCRIKEPNSQGIGEILIKGPNIMHGYYKNIELTKQYLQDGWLCTGDLGKIMKGNYLSIVGRKKNVIILKNGENVYPEELEQWINRIPKVKESLVYEKNGKIVAKIILKEQSHQIKKQEIQNEIDNINARIASYKKIQQIEIQEIKLTRTSTGKIKRTIAK